MTVKRIPQLNERQVARFWGCVDKSKECWEWQKCTNKSRRNYGLTGINGKLYQAHRVSYFLQFGVDPLEKLVCHSCDNPRCVKPTHLFLGTPLENMRDRDAKGRGIPPTGIRNGQAKLNEMKVLSIRQRHAEGESQMSISQSLGLCVKTINCVVRRVTWRHV